VDGGPIELRTVSDRMVVVNRLLVTLRQARQTLDRYLLHLSTLELDGYVTLADITNVFSNFEILLMADAELQDCVLQLGSEGRTVELQREQFTRGMDEDYTLMVRDYAADSSQENAESIRKRLHEMARKHQFQSSRRVAEALGYPDLDEDSVMAPLGLRTLSRVSVVREGMAEKILDEYGSLDELLGDIGENPDRRDDLGVNNPDVLVATLNRMMSNS
jgi:diadenylate cyclase